MKLFVRNIFLLSFFIFWSCSDIELTNKKGDSYMKYFIIESGNKYPRLITLYEEIFNQNGSNFIRVGYSFVEKLFVEFKKENKSIKWYSNINYKQDLNVSSFFNLHNIPRTEKEALKLGFRLNKKQEYKKVYIFEKNNNYKEISIFENGDVFVNKMRLEYSNNDFIEFRLSTQNSIIENQDPVIKKICSFREKAKMGESLLIEAERKYKDFLKNFKEEVGIKIKEILREFNNYYLGFIDYGLFSLDFEMNPEKAEFYFKRAIEIKKSRPEAYSYLYFLYKTKNDVQKIRKLKIEIKKNLNDNNHFITDKSIVLLLYATGYKEDSIQHLRKMQKRYKDDKFNLKLIELEKKITEIN